MGLNNLYNVYRITLSVIIVYLQTTSCFNCKYQKLKLNLYTFKITFTRAIIQMTRIIRVITFHLMWRLLLILSMYVFLNNLVDVGPWVYHKMTKSLLGYKRNIKSPEVISLLSNTQTTKTNQKTKSSK